MMSHNVTFIDIIGRVYHTVLIKIEMRSLFGQLICALFYQTNKRHIYETLYEADMSLITRALSSGF